VERIVVRDPDILGGTIDETVESYPSLSKADLIACLEGACASLKAAE